MSTVCVLEAGLGPRDTDTRITGLAHQGACGAAGYAGTQKSNRPVGQNIRVKGKKHYGRGGGPQLMSCPHGRRKVV